MRSIMLFSMKVLVVLGIRTIFLFGADFHMDTKKPYGFDEKKDEGASSSNNAAYEILNMFFSALRPQLESIGCRVFNTNPNSGLRSFDFIPFDKAIEIATSEIGDTATEPTEGMYRDLKLKRKESPPAPEVTHGSFSPEDGFEGQGKVQAQITPADAKAGPAVITHRELWWNRDKFVDLYPDLAGPIETGVNKINAMEARGPKGCKGCTFERCVQQYVEALFKQLDQNPAPFVENSFFELDRPVVRGRGDVPLLREVVHAG